MVFNEQVQLYLGDCLEKLKLIEDKSVNLVLIDPPYNISKAEWDKWKTVEDYVEFMGKVFLEIQRVLKDNGSFYFFHNDFLQIVELQNWINKNTEFVFKQLITWNKTNFKKFAWTNRNPEKCKDRNWFPNVEYALFYTFQDETGLNIINRKTNCNYMILREYIKIHLDKKGLKYNDKMIIDMFLSSGIYSNYNSARANAQNKLDFNKRSFEPMTEKLYNHLNEILEWEKSYKWFKDIYMNYRQEYESIRQEYEKDRYIFNLKEVEQNISCVWESKEGNSGKLHPCEKPQDILQKIIKTNSNEGDIVLDCFMGSGSTGVACAKTNRRFIGIELDEDYFNISEDRINRVLEEIA